jgi:hypothetical protein
MTVQKLIELLQQVAPDAEVFLLNDSPTRGFDKLKCFVTSTRKEEQVKFGITLMPDDTRQRLAYVAEMDRFIGATGTTAIQAHWAERRKVYLSEIV